VKGAGIAEHDREGAREGGEGEGKGGQDLRYDSGITSVMPVAGGCLTRKITKRCLVV